jgi:XTP/dITP diphosphohydrolase
MTDAQVPSKLSPTLAALQRLMDVVAQLRSPTGGCPWDLEQTLETLIPYVTEEAYEVADAIRQGEQGAIADELGDLLLQIVLQSQIASESGDFDMATVAEGISEKLIRRHPHVFGDMDVSSMDEIRQNWERIKSEENFNTNEQTLSAGLSRYARSLPPMMAAMKISQKVAKVGFEWDSIAGVWAKFQEELAEFQQALTTQSKAEQQAELGDLLFTLINIARWYDLDPTEALQGTNQRFIQRFSQVEAIADRPLSEYSLAELEAFWQGAKAKLAKQKDEL